MASPRWESLPSATATAPPQSPAASPNVWPSITTSAWFWWRQTTAAPACAAFAAWRPALAGAFATACLALGGQWLWQRQVEQRQLVDHVVASHVRATLGEHLVDVASSDRHTVKPWLVSRLDFSPPVQELPVPGSQFLGARIDFLAGRPVAALVYRQGNHVVTDYSWPAAGADSAAAVTSERGFRIAHWQRHGLAHWVISDVGSEGFAAVVQALVQAGAEP